MATEHMSNGSYAPHQAYGGMDQNTYGYASNTPAAAAQPPAATQPANTSAAAAQPDISKDEVGWYFVEQYYTTLSRSPEKLYLFYNKRSQFVSGQETDKVAVCVGQRAINDKIRELDFQDCKVRVTNVDSQASDSNIVIQVIGEISNKSQPHKKFTQTFVLATQTNGYFVLNDIFRYLVEEEEEVEAEAAAPAVEDVQQVSGTENSAEAQAAPVVAEAKTLTSSADPTAIEQGAKKVDQELEEKVMKPAEQETAAPTTNGVHEAEAANAVEVPAAAAPVETAVEAEPEQTHVEPEVEVEKPKDPEPTPIASPAKQAAPQSAPAPKPAVPSAPKTWAQLASTQARVAMPAAPAPATSSTGAPAPARAAVAAAKVAASAPSTAAPSAPSAPAAQRQQENAGSDSQDEWTAVGHTRQQSKQTNSNATQQDVPQYRGYIKNVQENVDAGELRSLLEKFGEVLYLDIARQKVC